MFFIRLTLTDQRHRAAAFMSAHNNWLAQGFADGAFLMAGSLEGGAGGAILAQSPDRRAIEARLAADPFVDEGIAIADITAFTPGRTDPRLDFLKG